MPTKQVTIQGIMTWEEGPLGFWGGSPVPHPGHDLPPVLGIWPSPGHPAHPIAPGGAPPGFWGGSPLPWPSHPIAPGGPPPGIWPSPGHPAHPIAPGGPPPGIWPSPGHPAHPIVLPPIPPDEITEDWGWAWSPFYGWVVVPPGSGGKPQPPSSDLKPTHPIAPGGPEPTKR